MQKHEEISEEHRQVSYAAKIPLLYCGLYVAQWHNGIHVPERQLERKYNYAIMRN